MSALLLYLRPDCHLCHQAEDEVARAGLAATAVDISIRPELERRYGLRIPVLSDGAGRRELDWPFTAKEVRQVFGNTGA